ncbi:4'-phosphopantetheinyl transferase family protein [Leptolyngbya sp. KIOST-1]|uniref:4'-phosphopantetheinyl transferase family protein n=1 Tax=Leptolyngbya sp. KIOST-1 TaxID=1229172 RepID=UPI0005639E8B|nr:4'-phosphopantetheinyl transferase superfamily protein [Leptolyngbya sp. KIOST-1]
MPAPGQVPQPSPRSSTVDLWLIATEQVERSELESLRTVLSAEEQARLEDLRLAGAQRQFILSRGCLRHLLSRYTKQPPQALTFAYGPRGKPALCPHHPGVTPVFNLSHSGTRLLLGVTVAPNIGAIGVDIERLRSVRHLPQLCRRYLTTTEAATVLRLEHPQADHRFLRYWTGKEAWLKAQGLGIADSLQAIALEIAEGEISAALTAIEVAAPAPLTPAMKLYQGPPEAHYTAAIAVQIQGSSAPVLHLKQTTPAAIALGLPNPQPTA